MRYLIKVTHLEGAHAGESYLLRKGGYVTDDCGFWWEDDVYKTEGIARRVCKHKYEENELSRRIERQTEEYRVKRGGKPNDWYIYESESYGPYPVADETVHKYW